MIIFEPRKNSVSLCRPLYCIATYRKGRYKACALWVHVYISDGAASRMIMNFCSDQMLHCSNMYNGQNMLSPSLKWTHNRQIKQWLIHNQIFYPDQEINWQVSVIMHRVVLSCFPALFLHFEAYQQAIFTINGIQKGTKWSKFRIVLFSSEFCLKSSWVLIFYGTKSSGA